MRPFTYFFIGLVSLSIALLAVCEVEAQQALFQKDETFITDLRKFIERKSDKNTNEIIDKMEELWGSSLSEQERALILNTSEIMYAKKFPANPTFEVYYDCIIIGKSENKLSEQQLLDFLETSRKTAKNLNVGTVNNFFNITNLFLKESKFAAFNNNELIVDEVEAFNFAYNGDASEYVPAPEEVAPIEPENTDTETENNNDTQPPVDDNDGWGDTNNNSGNTETEEYDPWAQEVTEVEETEWDSWENTDDEWDNGASGWGDEGTWGDDDGGSTSFDRINRSDFGPEIPIAALITAPQEGRDSLIQGPYIEIKNATITIKGRFDEAKIKQTNGRMQTVGNIFSGEGGRYDWTVKGLKGEAYNELDKYYFDIRKAAFKAEATKF